MRNRWMVFSLLVVALVGALTTSAFTEEEPAAGPPSPEALQEAWVKMATPGENHEWMAFFVGSWQVDAKFWMGPGEPQTSTGTSRSEWFLGKRFVRVSYSGDMEGTPFHGEATMGFNNGTQRYQSVWMDEMSTAIVTAEGTREGDVLTMSGKAQVPTMGEVAFRDRFTKVSDDEYTLEEWWTMPGMGEMKIMEMRYTRQP